MGSISSPTNPKATFFFNCSKLSRDSTHTDEFEQQPKLWWFAAKVWGWNSYPSIQSIAVSGCLNRWDRYHIITQLAVYTTYSPCQLGDYLSPIPPIMGTRKLHWYKVYNSHVYRNAAINQPAFHGMLAKGWHCSLEIHMCVFGVIFDIEKNTSLYENCVWIHEFPGNWIGGPVGHKIAEACCSEKTYLH